MPGAAMIPAWRIPPPSIFLYFLAFSMRPSGPTPMEPMGADRPLDRQIWTVSA